MIGPEVTVEHREAQGQISVLLLDPKTERIAVHDRTTGQLNTVESLFDLNL